LSQISTVVSEAILLDRPVILVDFSASNSFAAHFTGSGACLEVREPGMLAATVSQCLDDPIVRMNLEEARRQFVEDFFFGMDGKAAVRVAAIATRLAAEAHRGPNRDE
jgi:CDP-glycerol glycerophosphotransferase (TagB/SpsB family)